MLIMIVLVLAIVLFVLPELLRLKNKPATYQYPHVPDIPPMPENWKMQQEFQIEGITMEGIETSIVPSSFTSITTITELPPEKKSSFALSANQAALGIVYAEILSPPRCKRHLRN